MKKVILLQRIATSLMLFSNTQNQKLYMKRLRLDPSLIGYDSSVVDDVRNVPNPETAIPPTTSSFSSKLNCLPYDFLCQVTEAHLKNIPFENLAQHGGAGGPVTLDLSAIANKILERHRGGFCFELNGLLGAFLESTGFEVNYLPAIVYKPDIGGFDHAPTHLVLIVSLPASQSSTSTGPNLALPPSSLPSSSKDSTMYYVDVGFGEPPLHPLRYEFGGIEQVTPEGMKSRLILHKSEQDDEDSVVILEWFKEGKWIPRLQWPYEDYLLNPSQQRCLKDFQEPLDLVYDEGSNFSRKIIVCRLTRNIKNSLAGNVWKQTGRQVKITKLQSLKQVQELLRSEFGIPLEETTTLDLQKSLAQDPSLWAQM